MIERFYPNEYIDSVYELDINKFKKKGISAFVFDIDNTLAPFFVKIPDGRVRRFFERLKKNGMSVGIFSNNKRKRVDIFCRELNVIYEYKAGKPGLRGLKKMLKRLETKPSSAALIGDQIFTDIWCANRLGMYSVLVKPICKKDQFVTWLKRGIEGYVINAYVKETSK